MFCVGNGLLRKLDKIAIIASEINSFAYLLVFKFPHAEFDLIFCIFMNGICVYVVYFQMLSSRLKWNF